jgi:hypothetical protein
MRFLDLLESFGGRDINMSNQLTILEIFNDLIHEHRQKGMSTHKAMCSTGSSGFARIWGHVKFEL